MLTTAPAEEVTSGASSVYVVNTADVSRDGSWENLSEAVLASGKRKTHVLENVTEAIESRESGHVSSSSVYEGRSKSESVVSKTGMMTLSRAMFAFFFSRKEKPDGAGLTTTV